MNYSFCIRQIAASLMLVIVAMTWNTLIAQDEYQINTIEGESFSCTNISIDDSGVVSGSGLSQPLNLNGVSTIVVNRPANPIETSLTVRLVGGSHVRSNKVSFKNDKYSIETSAGNWQLGAESIQAIVVNGEPSSLLTRLMKEPENSNDQVVAKTGQGEQAVKGLVKEINDERVMFEFEGKVRPINRKIISGIVLADLQQTLPEGVRAKMQMLDGSTIVGTVRNLKDSVVTLGLAGGTNVKLEWNQVSRVSIQSDRVSFLSDLQPSEVQEQAFGTVKFGWQPDQNVFGRPLTLFDPETSIFKTYTRGVGTHSYCRLQFSIGGMGFSRFSAAVGLDEASKHRGDCEVEVIGDGLQLWSGRVTGNQAPQLIQVDVSSVDVLTLLVRPGEHLDLGDHVNWANARLLKSN